MLLDIASDLHMIRAFELSEEFYSDPGDVLILAGDIAPYYYFDTLKPFFERISDTWKRILFIPGNHEFYGEKYFEALTLIRNFFKTQFGNIFCIEGREDDIDDIHFIGSTMWSDMINNNPIVKLNCKSGLNDYNFISFDSPGEPLKKITPDDTVELFRNSLHFLKESLNSYKGGDVVIITHHAPSFKSVSEVFKGDPLNGAFVSNLEYLIWGNPHIKLWVHGHTHSTSDYNIGNCRIVCNPRGYSSERLFTYKPLRVEI